MIKKIYISYDSFLDRKLICVVGDYKLSIELPRGEMYDIINLLIAIRDRLDIINIIKNSHIAPRPLNTSILIGGPPHHNFTFWDIEIHLEEIIGRYFKPSVTSSKTRVLIQTYTSSS